MEPGHLLHSVLTRPSSADARRLKSRHPFLPSTQQLIISSDYINIRAALLADHQWNAEWADNNHKTEHFHPRHLQPSSMKSLCPAYPPPHMCRTFTLLLVQIGYGFLCGLWVWRRRTNRRPWCFQMSNRSTSPWTVWPEYSGRWDNRMAAQHLPGDSAAKQWLEEPSQNKKNLCVPGFVWKLSRQRECNSWSMNTFWVAFQIRPLKFGCHRY